MPGTMAAAGFFKALSAMKIASAALWMPIHGDRDRLAARQAQRQRRAIAGEHADEVEGEAGAADGDQTRQQGRALDIDRDRDQHGAAVRLRH